MKIFKLIVVCLFLLFAVVSCKSTKPTVTENQTSTKNIFETVHDTVFKTEIDTSTYKALLECRNGKVVIKEVTQTEPGRNLKSPKVRIDNNELKIDCYAKAQELFAKWKSKQSREIVTKRITNTIITNQLTFWQEAKIKGFYILFGLLLLVLLGFIIKQKLRL